MTKRKWHSGPPPHIGWWESSINREPHIWRWWGGQFWSHAVLEHTPHDAATEIAAMPIPKHMDEYIEWTNYYPANARVPRIKP